MSLIEFEQQSIDLGTLTIRVDPSEQYFGPISIH